MTETLSLNNIYDTKVQIEKVKSLSSDSQGKNSTVFIGKDIQMEKEFLIKQIKKDHLRQHTSDIFEEAKLLSKSSHRNIMPLQYSSYDEDYIYMAIPYFKKGSLDKFVNCYSSNRKLIEYCLDFLSGLAHAHVLGILHLDIKPSNIVIDDSDRALLTDFGQSHVLGDFESVSRSKPIYSLNFSPNILVNGEVCVDDDIYQVGLMLYRIFNNFYYQESINNLKNNNTTNTELATLIFEQKFPSNDFMPHIPNKIRNIIKKCLGRSNEKYQSIIEVMNDIARVDKKLDVGYEYSHELETIKWRKRTKSAIITIELDLKSNKVTAKKEVLATRNIQNVNKLNKSFTSRKDAFGAIKSHLEE